MFKLFKKEHADVIDATSQLVTDMYVRLSALEDRLDIEFFHGEDNKPHYRKRRERAKRKYTKRTATTE